MCEYLLKHLQRRISRFKRSREVIKKNIILPTAILILVMGVFFWAFSAKFALAEKSDDAVEVQVIFKPEYVSNIMELKDIGFIFGGEKPEYCENDNSKNIVDEDDEQQESIKIYPIVDIISEKLGFIGELEDAERDEDPKKYCNDNEEENDVDMAKIQKENKIFEMVANHPIEEMIPFISERSDSVAYYLVAIAKKESNWGKRSPQKNGSTCYNYWGYKGSYNKTESGYSCFDSPEQAVQQVGNRIESLISKNIDTPEEMVVWKCGSTCAGHDPQGVLKWISDVKLYYKKLSV